MIWHRRVIQVLSRGHVHPGKILITESLLGVVSLIVVNGLL